jgi:hypothetical protein
LVSGRNSQASAAAPLPLRQRREARPGSVIARSEATKQSRATRAALDCFGPAGLAMTVCYSAARSGADDGCTAAANCLA